MDVEFAHLDILRWLSLLLLLTMLGDATSSLHIRVALFAFPFCILWLSVTCSSLYTFRGLFLCLPLLWLDDFNFHLGFFSSSCPIVCLNSFLETICLTPHTSWHGYFLSVFLRASIALSFRCLDIIGDELSSHFNARGMIFTFAHLRGFTCVFLFCVLMTLTFTLALLIHLVPLCALTPFKDNLLDSTH